MEQIRVIPSIYLEAVKVLRAGQRSILASGVRILCEIGIVLCGGRFEGVGESWLNREVYLLWFMQDVFVMALFASERETGCWHSIHHGD